MVGQCQAKSTVQESRQEILTDGMLAGVTSQWSQLTVRFRDTRAPQELI